MDDPEVNNWLLKDGTMLDFMENPHWDIAKCMTPKKRKFVLDASYEFMDDTSAIRVHYNGAYGMFIEGLKGREPSDRQKRILGPLCRRLDCTFGVVEKRGPFGFRARGSERRNDPAPFTDFLRMLKKENER